VRLFGRSSSRMCWRDPSRSWESAALDGCRKTRDLAVVRLFSHDVGQQSACRTRLATIHSLSRSPGVKPSAAHNRAVELRSMYSPVKGVLGRNGVL
jgi:hypothetical protein